MKIYAPVKDANGVYASVRFVNGVGETDNPKLIEWFKAHGYKVPLEKCEETPEKPNEKCEISSQIPYEKCDEPTEVDPMVDESEFVEINKLVEEEPDEPDFDAMTPFELREWMKEHGLGMEIGNTRNKEKLLEILRR